MKYIFSALLGIGMVMIMMQYYSLDYALVCPFKTITGYDCSGCGSQRALHYLLHGEVKKALVINPLFVMMLPYAAVFFVFRIKAIQHRFPTANKLFFGFKTIVVILALILIFGLLRNTIYYQAIMSRF